MTGAHGVPPSDVSDSFLLDLSPRNTGGPEPVRNLDLSTREGMLKGGGRGPAVVPGDVLESILYRTITHQHDLKMPKDKPKLPDADIKLIKNWIEDGAPWEAPEDSKDSKSQTESKSGK